MATTIRNAEELYKLYKYIPLGGGDLYAAQVLTNVCKNLAKTYEQKSEDQNNYIFDLEEDINQINELQQTLEEEINTKEAEKEKILSNAQDGCLNEEEKTKLKIIDNDISELNSNVQTKINGISAHAETLKDEAQKSNTSKDTALDYAQTTIEKGEPLKQTKDKNKTFFRKLFHTWDKSQTRQIGEEAVSAGTNLEDIVSLTENNNDIIRKFSIKNN